jgi:hypothetical protein
MSKKRWIAGLVASALAFGFLAIVPGEIRQRDIDEFDRQARERGYWSNLYRVRVKAVDDETSAPVNIDLKWDGEAISTASKGYNASVIETDEKNGTKSLTAVGRWLEDGLPVSVEANGYVSTTIEVVPQSSGLLTTTVGREIQEVRLRRQTPALTPQQ